jgi:metal-responsive CopG/Arc/MetJ family transcriptional regulator
MATDKPRYSITVDEELFKQIEDFRFENRFQTRNQATIELIRRGLAAIKEEAKPDE